jgi:GH24 family phage-related lysozyme (muramidase)
MAQGQQDQVQAAFEKLMADREGCRNVVYKDTLGKPTVGIGHLVVASDNLQVGDRITDEQITTFFQKDGAAALSAARLQAVEAGITDPDFIPYLGSVNFQLGTHWTNTFPNTWKMIVDGKYEEAARALDGTQWAPRDPRPGQGLPGCAAQPSSKAINADGRRCYCWERPDCCSVRAQRAAPLPLASSIASARAVLRYSRGGRRRTEA